MMTADPRIQDCDCSPVSPCPTTPCVWHMEEFGRLGKERAHEPVRHHTSDNRVTLKTLKSITTDFGNDVARTSDTHDPLRRAA
ncbi:hypothetical protein MEX01_54040 [Methylorubrum extorquens]|nr:hypothetical protein MEX01_54040 [Methylorubrum extorquens]